MVGVGRIVGGPRSAIVVGAGIVGSERCLAASTSPAAMVCGDWRTVR
jgi:hypothetical protein